MNDQDDEPDRWILASVHRWDSVSVRSGYSATLEEENPDDWYITVNWRLVDGRAMPVGIEVHSSRKSHREGDAWPERDRPKAVSRELFKRLPVGEVIEQGRSQVAAIWDAMTSRMPDEPEARRVRAGLANKSDPGSPADWKYRLTAQVYREVKADQERNLVGRATAQEVHLRLVRDYKLTASPGRVRKWIQEAGKRGYLHPYLPKASPKTPASRPDSRDTNGRKDR
jgi:hypothetical protein